MAQHYGNLVKAMLLIAESCSLEQCTLKNHQVCLELEVFSFSYQESLGFL